MSVNKDQLEQWKELKTYYQKILFYLKHCFNPTDKYCDPDDKYNKFDIYEFGQGQLKATVKNGFNYLEFKYQNNKTKIELIFKGERPSYSYHSDLRYNFNEEHNSENYGVRYDGDSRNPFKTVGYQAYDVEAGYCSGRFFDRKQEIDFHFLDCVREMMRVLQVDKFLGKQLKELVRLFGGIDQVFESRITYQKKFDTISYFDLHTRSWFY